MKKKQSQLFAPDPFEHSHVSYKWYCLAHGAASPEEMRRIENKRTHRTCYLEWFRQQFRAAEAAGVAEGWPISYEWMEDWVREGRHLEVEGGHGV